MVQTDYKLTDGRPLLDLGKTFRILLIITGITRNISALIFWMLMLLVPERKYLDKRKSNASYMRL